LLQIIILPSRLELPCSETLALTYAIADALNEAQPGFKMIVLESGGSGENL